MKPSLNRQTKKDLMKIIRRQSKQIADQELRIIFLSQWAEDSRVKLEKARRAFAQDPLLYNDDD